MTDVLISYTLFCLIAVCAVAIGLRLARRSLTPVPSVALWARLADDKVVDLREGSRSDESVRACSTTA